MKKSSVLIAAIIVGLLGGTGYFYTKSQSPPPPVEKESIVIAPERYQHGKEIFITPDELKAKLGSEKLVILDGSHPKVYAKGHIPGAISMGFKGLSRSNGKPGTPLWGTILPKDQLTAKLESFGITNDTLVVAYSDIFKGPGAGGRAVWQLHMAGLKNVRLLYGGLEIWKQLGYELSTEAVQPTPATGLVLNDYDATFRAQLDYMKENLGKVVYLDVRSKDEFTGEDTSRGEARPGHIAGAQWISWKAFMNENTTPKSPEEIIALMADFGLTPEDEFVVY